MSKGLKIVAATGATAMGVVLLMVLVKTAVVLLPLD